MGDRLDSIDYRILYRLAQDARNPSPPAIAEEVSVTPGTVRNRIAQLEADGIIKGYHANIDYERVDGRLTNLFTCTSPVPERDRHAKQAAEIPGVIEVQRLLSGQENLHITVVADDMSGIARIAHDISELGIEIEEEDLVERKEVRAYQPFGPEARKNGQSIADFMSLSGDAEVIELSIDEGAPIAGRTLGEANEAGIIDPEVLIVSVEREGDVLTPRGDTRITAGDLVTLFCRKGVREEILAQFRAVD